MLSDGTDASRHEEGMRVRREVLGDAPVDRAIARTNPFTEKTSRTPSRGTRGVRSGHAPASTAGRETASP